MRMESKKRGRPLGVRNGQLRSVSHSKPNILRRNQYRDILPKDNHANIRLAEQCEESEFLLAGDITSGACDICLKTENVSKLKRSHQKKEFSNIILKIIGKRIFSNFDINLCFTCFQALNSYFIAQETLQSLSKQLSSVYENGEKAKSSMFWSGRKTKLETLNESIDEENVINVIELKLNNSGNTNCDMNLKFVKLEKKDEDEAPTDLCQILLKSLRLKVEMDVSLDFFQHFDIKSSTITDGDLNNIVQKVSFGSEGIVQLSLQKGEYDFECQECKEGFSNIYDCIKHVNRHELQHWISINGNGVQCKFCGRCFKYESNLEGHVEMYHTIRKYKCEYCGCVFSNKLKMMSHTKEHIIYICSYCNETFVNEDSLNFHMRNHNIIQEDKEYPKEIDNSKISNRNDIVEIKTLDGWICQVCNKLFQRKSNYNEHLQRHLGFGDKPCPYCKELFFASSLRKHISTKHANQTSMESFNNKPQYSKNKSLQSCSIHCHICNLPFKCFQDLENHKKSFHLDIISESIPLFGVSQSLEDKSILVTQESTLDYGKQAANQLHDHFDVISKPGDNSDQANFSPLPTILKVLNKTLYHCTICSACFEHLKSYNLHLQSKHLKPFLCQICKDSSFPTNILLDQHQMNCGALNFEAQNQNQE